MDSGLGCTLITVSGDAKLFNRFRSGLENGLPSESLEWKRWLGRAHKIVSLKAKCVPLQPEKQLLSPAAIGADFDNGGLQGRSLRDTPVLHTYWVECPDLDTYKSSVKDDLWRWLTLLRKLGIAQDWAVVLVETPESKKANKLLPRTNLLDKVKTDVGGKTPERCLSLIVVDGRARTRLRPGYPTKNDSRAADSWQTLLHRIRLLILEAYNRILGKFEESMRAQRERRNDPEWNFCSYFLLQEELAMVYEMLGVFDEALVQYDELDALFTQFVLNSGIGECPEWLRGFSVHFHEWSGLSLDVNANARLREAIKNRNPTLLDFRNYLFARQSALMLKLHKPWEMASRALTFLHNTANEIDILDLGHPEGAIACWILMSCLEVLATCERYSETENRIQLYSLHTASIRAYARKKLEELGSLCGLMPDCGSQNSEQLHKVVELSSGIRCGSEEISPAPQQTPENNEQGLNIKIRQLINPTKKLKEALSSKKAFQKFYLELCEVSISTFKHIGRTRSARIIGIDLAKFYLMQNKVPQAVTFFLDALKTFQAEGWQALELATLQQVAECYRRLNEDEKLLRICAQIAAFPKIKDSELTQEARIDYFNEMTSLITGLERSMITDGDEMIIAKGTKILNHPQNKIVPEAEVKLEIELENRFPCVLECDFVGLSLSYQEPPQAKSKPTLTERRSGGRSVKRTPSTLSSASTSTTNTQVSQNDSYEDALSPPASLDVVNDLPPSFIPTTSGENSVKDLEDNKLVIVEETDVKQDKTKSVSAARLNCQNAALLLKRKDSSGIILRDGQVKKTDFTLKFRSSTAVSLAPGLNKIVLTTTAGPVGKYDLSQLSVCMHKKRLELLSGSRTHFNSSFLVISQPPTIGLALCTDHHEELLAGVDQEVEIVVSTGSFQADENSTLKINCSRGLFGSPTDSFDCWENAANRFDIRLPEEAEPRKPFSQYRISLRLLSDLPFFPPNDPNNPTNTSKDPMMSSKPGQSLEHRLTVVDPWLGHEHVLSMHFASPFLPLVRLKTARERKYIEVSLRRSAASLLKKDLFFMFRKPMFEVINGNNQVKIELVQGAEEELELGLDAECSYFFQLQSISKTEDGFSSSCPDPLRTKLSLQFTSICDSQQEPIWRQLALTPEFKSFRTLYVVSSRVTPSAKSGEICKAATICILTLEIEKVNETCHTSLMYEVLADQAVWAVCGRAAAVIDMSATDRQTLVVEVMPLVGGHLRLPKVRISKYIPAGANANGEDKADSSSSSAAAIPRLEPFAPSQIYNQSHYQQIHVLSNSSGGGSQSSQDKQQPPSNAASAASRLHTMLQTSSRSLFQGGGTSGPVSLP